MNRVWDILKLASSVFIMLFGVWGFLMAGGLASGIGTSMAWSEIDFPTVRPWGYAVLGTILTYLLDPPWKVGAFLGALAVSGGPILMRLSATQWRWARYEHWAVAVFAFLAALNLAFFWSSLFRIGLALALMLASLAHVLWFTRDLNDTQRVGAFAVVALFFILGGVILLPYRFGQGFFDFEVFTTKRIISGIEFKYLTSDTSFVLTCTPTGGKSFHFGKLQVPTELLNPLEPSLRYASTLRGLVGAYQCEGSRLEPKPTPSLRGGGQ